MKVTDAVAMGDSVAHVAISGDGTKALAVKPVANKVAFLKIDGKNVVYEKYDYVSCAPPTSSRAFDFTEIRGTNAGQVLLA